MLDFSGFEGIYFFEGVVDFRKSIDGLSILVQQTIKKDLFGPNLFLFVSRDKKKIKLLYWDKTGFWLCYKRLEQERFRLRRNREDKTVIVERRQLEWLLAGIDWWKIKPHKPVFIEKVV